MATVIAWSVLVFALVAFCAALRRPREVWEIDAEEGPLARLGRQRGRLLRAIKDLETEHEAGTLSDDEFQSLRLEYKRRAVAVSKELDRARRGRLRALRRDDGVLDPARRRSIEEQVARRLADTKETA